MPRKIYLCVLVALTITIFACNNKIEQEVATLITGSGDNATDIGVSTEYHIGEDGYIWNYFDTLTELIKDEKNYKIYTDKGNISLYFEVINNNGELIDSGYHGWRGGVGLSFNEDGILILDESFGSILWNQRYYDVTNSRVSRFFFRPVQTHGEVVVYFTPKETGGFILVIQNMFDPGIYYKETERDFSLFVWTMPSTAEFLDDGKKLSITYWLEPDDKEVTEIINL